MEKIPFSYLFSIVILNIINILFQNYYQFGELSWLTKNPSPLLNSNRLSGYFALFIPILVYQWRISKITKKYYHVLIFGAVLIAVLFFQYSRAGLISICLYFIYLYFSGFDLKSKFRKYFSYTFFSILFLLIFSPVFTPWIETLDIQTINFLNDKSSGRVELWSRFINIYSTLPLINKIFGLGIGEHNFYLYYIPLIGSDQLMDNWIVGDGLYIHPHNLAFTLLIYSGIVGVLFYIFILIYFFIKIIKINLTFNKIFVFSFIIFIVHNAFDSLYDTMSIVGMLSYLFFLSIKPNFLNFQNKEINTNIHILKSIFILVFLIFMLLRALTYFENNKNENLKMNSIQNISQCSITRIPDGKYLSDTNPLILSDRFFQFPNQRISQENFLFSYTYWKKNPSIENKNKLDISLSNCIKYHFRPIICEAFLDDDGGFKDLIKPYKSSNQGFWIAEKVEFCLNNLME